MIWEQLLSVDSIQRENLFLRFPGDQDKLDFFFLASVTSNFMKLRRSTPPLWWSLGNYLVLWYQSSQIEVLQIASVKILGRSNFVLLLETNLATHLNQKLKISVSLEKPLINYWWGCHWSKLCHLCSHWGIPHCSVYKCNLLNGMPLFVLG